MNASANQDLSARLAGPFDNPFKNWPNNDLLVDVEDRAFFARHYPVFCPIFDWPEIRSLFEEHNALAATARKHSRRAGIFAVACGFLSLSVAAGVPLAAELSKNTALSELRIQAVLGAVAAALAIVSIFIGYTQVLRGKEKARWLTNRFWSERIRQFHFQLIINNLPRLVSALKVNAKLREWLDYRARELDRFKHIYLRGVEDKLNHLEADEAEDHPWLFEEWDEPGPIPAESPEFDKVLELLEQHRFGIQQRYAEKQLLNGWHSPQTRAQMVSKLSDVLTGLILLATIAAGIGAVIAFRVNGNPTSRLIAGLVAAIASAGVVAMRALKEGLLFNDDAERYKWYLAAVRSLRARFEPADRPKKVLLLRELEHVAYQEMRRFMLSGSKARFLM
jgi:hypothetical protein